MKREVEVHFFAYRRLTALLSFMFKNSFPLLNAFPLWPNIDYKHLVGLFLTSWCTSLIYVSILLLVLIIVHVLEELI